MLPTFVIGLREGLEAALIVGIVAAFLRQRGRLDLLRWVFVGVGAAVVLCVGVGVVLDVVSRDLPQRQQEGLETVVGLVAVSMVTYMVVWMRRHARDLKGQLEASAGDALASGSGWALVAMAFLAVLREGFETVVFLLAAFNESGSGNAAALGAVLGILVAVGLGWGLYRGGVRLNLARFFRITGFVLVLVAAGLLVSALRTAHEAAWLNIGQRTTVDLSAVVAPGSVRASLLTGILGIQTQPVVIEVIGWFAYLVPVGLYVLWPAGRGVRRSTVERLGLVGGAIGVAVAVALVLLAPARSQVDPVTAGSDGTKARVVSSSPDTVVLRTDEVGEVTAPAASSTLRRVRVETHDGVSSVVYVGADTHQVTGFPATMTIAELASRNGGRLPIGVRATDASATVPISYTDRQQMTAWIDPLTDRVIDVQADDAVTAIATLEIGPTPIGSPRTTTRAVLSPSTAQAAAAARHDEHQFTMRRTVLAIATIAGVAGATALVAAGLSTLQRRRRPEAPSDDVTEGALAGPV